LRRLIEICDERNIFLIVDETYREFAFDNRKPVSVLELAPDNPRVIVVDSLSKRFSLCGARIGCLITKNTSFMQSTLAVAQARLSCSTIEQVAAAYMLERISPDFVEKIRLEYEIRRNALLVALKKLSGVKVATPQGAFYAMAQLPVDDAESFASFMLSDFSHEGCTTFIAPAQGFYLESERGMKEARIAFVLDKDSIARAIEILGYGLIKYNDIKK
jgi:aspartate aminotransferase